MQEYKLFAQRIVLVGITKFINNFKGIILLPVLTKNLPIQDYGIWAQVMVTIGIIPGLMALGLPGAMVRFLPSVKVNEKLKDIFYSFLSAATITGLFSSFLIYLESDSIANLLFGGNVYIVQMLSIVVFFETIEKVHFNYFRATEQIKKHSFLLFTKNFLLVILTSIFVLMGGGLLGAITGLLVNSIIVFLISISTIILQVGLKLPKFDGIKVYLNYSMPTIPGIMSNWIVKSSDRYIIGGYLGTSAVGFYTPGYTLGNIIQMFIAPLDFLLPMIISKHYDENNLKEVKKYLEYSLKYFLAISIPSFFGLSLLSKPILVILSTPEIAEQSYLITPFVALGILIFGILKIIQKVIIIFKKTIIIGNIWILVAILNISLNIILIPYIGIIVAAITTLLSFLVALILMSYYSFKLLKLDINFTFIIKSLLSSILMSSIIIFWNPINIFSYLIMIFVCAILYFIILILLRCFDEQEIKFFKSFLKSIITKV